jgi:hypothetical protein
MILGYLIFKMFNFEIVSPSCQFSKYYTLSTEQRNRKSEISDRSSRHNIGLVSFRFIAYAGSVSIACSRSKIVAVEAFSKSNGIRNQQFRIWSCINQIYSSRGIDFYGLFMKQIVAVGICLD